METRAATPLRAKSMCLEAMKALAFVCGLWADRMVSNLFTVGFERCSDRQGIGNSTVPVHHFLGFQPPSSLLRQAQLALFNKNPCQIFQQSGRFPRRRALSVRSHRCVQVHSSLSEESVQITCQQQRNSLYYMRKRPVGARQSKLCYCCSASFTRLRAKRTHD